MDSPSVPPPASPPAASLERKGGCIFAGCLGLLLLAGICVLGFALSVAGLIQTAVTHLTDSTPAEISRWEPAPEEAAALLQQVNAFTKSLTKPSPQPSPQLILKGAEANALLLLAPSFLKNKDQVFLYLEGEQLRCQTAIPLGKFGPFDLSKRYLNADARFQISLANGVMIATVDKLKLGSQELSERVMIELRKTNFAKELYRDAETARKLRKLEGIAIHNGQLTVTARSPSQPE